MADAPRKRRSERPHPVARGAGERPDARSEFFFAAVATSPVPMTVADPHQPDTPIVFANSAFGRLTGYAPEDLLGTNGRLLEGSDTDRETLRQIQQAIEQRQAMTTEVLNYRKDGSNFWNALSVSPVFDRSGTLVYLFGTHCDVSRSHSAEEALGQALKRAGTGELPDGIAHDFNNLLQVIGGHTDMLLTMARKSNFDAARLVRAGEAIRGATDRAIELTRHLLAFTRRHRP